MEQSNVCIQCEYRESIWKCSSCDNIVCDNVSCCLTFPHYKNGLHIVCNMCKVRIEGKLKLVVDIDKLKLLKQKIQKRRVNRY